MKIVIINLDRSKDRRAFMLEQMRAQELEHEFFSAVDAARGDLADVSRYDEQAALWKLGHPLLPAGIGCFASHYRLWERCAAGGEPLVIMEDDVTIGAGFSGALRVASEHLDRWNFIRLAGLSRRTHSIISATSDPYRLVRFWKGPRGTQCYALSPRGARLLLQHAQTWIDAVDLYIDGFWVHGLDSVAVLPFHVTQVGNAVLPTVVGGVAGAAPRPWHRKVRRATTHLLGRVRRGICNLRYRLRPRSDNSTAMEQEDPA